MKLRRMTLTGRILCLLGWHDWRYKRAPRDALSIGFTGAYRDCKRCGLREYHRDIHGYGR